MCSLSICVPLRGVSGEHEEEEEETCTRGSDPISGLLLHDIEEE